MSNKTVRISDKLNQWEAENDPLAPLSSSQINAYLSLSEQIGNTDFIVYKYTFLQTHTLPYICLINSYFSLVFRY